MFSYFVSQAPADNCHVNVLYFLGLTMRVCHQVMMSGVKCHPHIRETLTSGEEEKITTLISIILLLITTPRLLTTLICLV